MTSAWTAKERWAEGATSIEDALRLEGGDGGAGTNGWKSWRLPHHESVVWDAATSSALLEGRAYE